MRLNLTDEQAGALEDILSYYLMAAPTTEAEGASETEIETASHARQLQARLSRPLRVIGSDWANRRSGW